MDKLSVKRFSFRRKGSNKKDIKKDGECHEEKIDEIGQHKMKYISQTEAQTLYQELCTEYSYSIDQLLELSGYSCAVAVSTCYPVEKMTKDNNVVLVCCGPGNNGGDGLVCARHLKMFGYKPTIFYPKRTNTPLFDRLFKQCESLDIPVLSFFPSEPHLITDSYNFVVDALFGTGFVDTTSLHPIFINITSPLRQEFKSAMETLKNIESPICSIDIPSGWDIVAGDDTGLQPELLVSLAVPKMCAKLFKGTYHFLGGRFIPKTLDQKYALNLQIYPGSDCVVEIKSENSENRSKENNVINKNDD